MYHPLSKAFEKRMKTIEDQIRKQIEALVILKPMEHQEKTKSIEGIFPKELENNEIKNKLNESKNLEEVIDRDDL